MMIFCVVLMKGLSQAVIVKKKNDDCLWEIIKEYTAEKTSTTFHHEEWLKLTSYTEGNSLTTVEVTLCDELSLSITFSW